jgi:hypothetical protein
MLKLDKIVVFSSSVVVLLLLIVFGFALLPKNSVENFSSSFPGTALLVINAGESDYQTFDLALSENTTCFDLLKKASQLSNFELSYKNSGFGVFVESVKGKKNGQDGKYWLYYVNGKSPKVAADKMKVKKDDKVEFRFEKPNF